MSVADPTEQPIDVDRLWQKQGRPKGLDLLEPIEIRFTRGHDHPHVQVPVPDRSQDGFAIAVREAQIKDDEVKFMTLIETPKPTRDRRRRYDVASGSTQQRTKCPSRSEIVLDQE